MTALVSCDREPAVPTCQVERRNFQREIVADGILQATQSQKITAPTDVDTLLHLEWIVADGSPVEAGSVVARFDPTPWTRELESARDDSQGVDLKRSRHQVERTSDERRSELDVGMARDELAHALRFQAKDELIFSRNERIESQLDADLAQRKEEHALSMRDVQRRISSGEGRLIDLEGRVAEQNIDRAERGLAALTATAPTAGLAVLVRNWRGETPQPGSNVWPGQPIAEIPDLSAMKAELFVLEADAGGLAPGQSATVHLEARGGTDVAARVERVDQVAKPRVSQSPVQYFGVTLSLAETDPVVMKPGARVQARVEVLSMPQALVVPRTAVFEEAEQRVVFRRVGTRFEPVAVEVAASANGLVALTGAIEAGDTVALADPRGESEAGAEVEAAAGSGR